MMVPINSKPKSNGITGSQTTSNVAKRIASTQLLKKAIGNLKRFMIPLIATVIVLGIGLAGGGVSAPANLSSDAPRPLDVKVAAVEHAAGYQARRNYLGRIESSRDSRISFEFGGKINVVHFDEGQVVQRGDILATLDTEILESNFNALTAQIKSAQAQLDELIAGPRREDIAAAEANVRRWESQLKLALITRKRMLRLLKTRSVSDQEADESVYREQTVAAQLDLATANLKELVNGSRIEQVEAQRAALNHLEA